MRTQNSSYSFKHLIQSSQSFNCNKCIHFTYGFSNDEYLYLMVNRKYGNAPRRNLFKRRARVLFSKLIERYSNLNIGLMVKPLKQNISFQDLTDCFDILNKKIKEKF